MSAELPSNQSCDADGHLRGIGRKDGVVVESNTEGCRQWQSSVLGCFLLLLKDIFNDTY